MKLWFVFKEWCRASLSGWLEDEIPQSYVTIYNNLTLDDEKGWVQCNVKKLISPWLYVTIALLSCVQVPTPYEVPGPVVERIKEIDRVVLQDHPVSIVMGLATIPSS